MPVVVFDSVNKISCDGYELRWPVFHRKYSEEEYQSALRHIALNSCGVVVGSVVKVVNVSKS